MCTATSKRREGHLWTDCSSITAETCTYISFGQFYTLTIKITLPAEDSELLCGCYNGRDGERCDNLYRQMPTTTTITCVWFWFDGDYWILTHSRVKHTDRRDSFSSVNLCIYVSSLQWNKRLYIYLANVYSGFEIKIIPEELSGLLTPSILISYYTNISIF